jgi:rhodanese-related sulfurtransferase
MPLFYMASQKGVSAQLVAERYSSGRKPQIIDVRSPAEFDSGHLPGAVNIPMESIESRLPDIDLKAPTVLVCQGGTRAGVVCQQVGSKFDDIAVLDGGTDAWINSGAAVVRTTRSRKPLMQQALLGAGILNASGILLSLFVHPAFIGFSVIVACGLMLAGTTGICLMALILAKMPWNRKPSDASSLSCTQG